MFSEVSHDFGTVAKDAKVEYRFAFSNIYQEPVHVVGVHSSCGCTEPSVTKSDLKTYEKSEIVAKFNTRAFTGNHAATLTVTIDRPFYAEVQLSVWGDIRTDLTVRPEQVELGTVDQGQEVERRITISHSGRADWKIIDVRSVNTNYEVEVIDGPRRGGQVEYDLAVKLKKDAPPGYVSDQLILVTNDPRVTQFPIEVEGLVNAELTATPQALSFGAVEAGHKAIRPVIVRGRKPFKVTAIKCDDDSFSFKAPDTANKIQTVVVTFTASDKAGAVVKKLHIETDLGKSFVADVLVQADVKPSTSAPATTSPATASPTTTSPAAAPSAAGPPASGAVSGGESRKADQKGSARRTVEPSGERTAKPASGNDRAAAEEASAERTRSELALPEKLIPGAAGSELSGSEKAGENGAAEKLDVAKPDAAKSDDVKPGDQKPNAAKFEGSPTDAGKTVNATSRVEKSGRLNSGSIDRTGANLGAESDAVPALYRYNPLRQ